MPQPIDSAAHSCRRPSPIVVLLAAAGIGLTGIAACSSGTSSPPATTPTAANSAVPTSAAHDLRRALLSCGRLPNGH